MHEMRKTKKQITDTAAMEEILQQAQVLRLAMCDEGQPYVLPLNYGYREGRIYIHCALEGRKLDILRKNPKVCFEASTDLCLRTPADPDDSCGFGMHFRCVVGEGLAEIVEDPEEKRHGLDVLMDHYAQGPHNYNEKALGLVAVIRIDVRSMSGKQDLA